MKPTSAKVFQILGWIAVGLTGTALLVFLIILLKAMQYLSDAGYGYAYERPSMLPVWIIWAVQLIATGGMATAVYLVGQRRSGVGRGLFLGMTGLVLLTLLVSIVLARGGEGILILVFVILLGSYVAPTVFLFLSDTSAWLAGRPIQPRMNGGASQWVQQPYQPAQAAADYSQPIGHPIGYRPPEPGADTASLPSGALRPCPYCAEPIRAEANKCRFCGSDVSPAA